MLAGATGWPADLAHRYRAAGYWRGEPLADSLRRYAHEHTGTAVVSGPTRLTYTELDALVDRRASGFAALGLRAGNRAVVQLPNTAEFLVTAYAMFRIGVLPLFALPGHRRAELEFFLDHVEAGAYVIPDRHLGFDHRALAAELAATRPGLRVLVDGDADGFVPLAELIGPPRDLASPDPADVGLFLLSGGTTGVPKLVARTHDDWAYSGRAVAERCGYDATTRHMVCLPLGHNWTLTHGMLAALHAGGTLVLAPSPNPGEAFPIIEREAVTDTGLVPGAALAWVEEAPYTRHDLSSLRHVVIGGTKLATELARRVEPVLGCQVQQAFGMAEGLCGFHTDDDPDEIRLTTQGRPVSPADELLVVDTAGEPVAAGEPGELLTRGPYTVRGYFASPGHDARSFTPDGFYRTGDIVRLLPGGYVVFEGKLKEQINRGGEKIAPEEVEDQLLAHPQVRDVALAGLPDEVLGERSCAFVIPQDPAAPPGRAELTEFLTAAGLAAFKIPDRVVIVDSLPRSPIGKIDRKALVAEVVR